MRPRPKVPYDSPLWSDRAFDDRRHTRGELRSRHNRCTRAPSARPFAPTLAPAPSSGRLCVGPASNSAANRVRFMPGRTRAERRADALRRLETDENVWVSTAGVDGSPHLVPLSLAWDGSRILVATPR